MADLSEGERELLRFRIILSIKHPNIDPALITERLGLLPMMSWKAGEQRMTPKGTVLQGKHKASAWGHSFHVYGDRLFFKSLCDFVGRLEQKADVLLNIHETGGAVMLVVQLPGDVNIGDQIGFSDMKRLFDLKISLGIEVFPNFN